MEERIIEIIKRVLNTDGVNEVTSQTNCEKWDSLHHLNLVVELEDEFETEFEPEEIADMKSVKAIEKIIKSKMS